MKENELLMTHQVGDVINILQKTSHQLFDPDELLTVSHACPSLKTEFIYSSFVILTIDQQMFSGGIWENRINDYQHDIKAEEEAGTSSDGRTWPETSET